MEVRCWCGPERYPVKWEIRAGHGSVLRASRKELLGMVRARPEGMRRGLVVDSRSSDFLEVEGAHFRAGQHGGSHDAANVLNLPVCSITSTGKQARWQYGRGPWVPRLLAAWRLSLVRRPERTGHPATPPGPQSAVGRHIPDPPSVPAPQVVHLLCILVCARTPRRCLPPWTWPASPRSSGWWRRRRCSARSSRTPSTCSA